MRALHQAFGPFSGLSSASKEIHGPFLTEVIEQWKDLILI